MEFSRLMEACCCSGSKSTTSLRAVLSEPARNEGLPLADPGTRHRQLITRHQAPGSRAVIYCYVCSLGDSGTCSTCLGKPGGQCDQGKVSEKKSGGGCDQRGTEARSTWGPASHGGGTGFYFKCNEGPLEGFI